MKRKHPEREKRHVGVFPEDGGEHLGPALPREPRRLVICGIIRLQTVLFRFRIILGVHENSPQSTLLRQPGDCPHVRGEGPPGRIVGLGGFDDTFAVVGQVAEKVDACALLQLVDAARVSLQTCAMVVFVFKP